MTQSPMSTDYLEDPKQCPLCGSLAVIASSGQATKIRCLDGNCGLSITRFRWDGSDRKAALMAWNRRPFQAESPMSIEARDA